MTVLFTFLPGLLRLQEKVGDVPALPGMEEKGNYFGKA